MSRAKTYKRDQKAKFGLKKEVFMTEMQHEGLENLILYECNPVVKSKNIICRQYRSKRPKSGCGQVCDQYMPCNGTSGMCAHRSFIQSPIRKVLLSVNGNIKFLSK